MRPMKPPIRVIGPSRFGPGRVVPDLPHTADHLWRRLYICGVDDDLEKLHGYRPGGYYPIHIQDELHNGQYRIIHKLGHGGYATVWLCRDQHVDTPSYVAIKILVASQTGKDSRELLLSANLKGQAKAKVPLGQHFCLPLKHFLSQSPNGTHICLVFPVLGPAIRDATAIFAEDGAMQIAREVLRQTVGNLALLHSRDICHGDLRPSNVLLELQELSGLNEEHVLSLLGKPETTDVHVRQDSRPTPEIPYAPKYLVYPPDFANVTPSLISSRSRLIDFGQSFDTSQQPLPSAFGIPANYAAPEVVLDSLGSTAMDLWSLGCTLYEVRLGRRLFDVFQLVGLRKEDYLDEIASVLGKPPEAWAKYCPESDDGSDTSTSPSNDSPSEHEDIRIEPQVQRARSIQEKLASCHDCAGQKCAHPRFQLISEAEAATLADLLEKLLRYKPEDRLAAQDVLKHAWFHTISTGG